jgi:predicted amino acid-binding ACT domain protein
MATTIKQAILFATENSEIDNFSRTVVRYDLLMTKLAELSKVEKDNYQSLKEENEEYKKLLEKLREKMQFEDFFTDEFLDIDNLLTKHSK